MNSLVFHRSVFTRFSTRIFPVFLLLVASCGPRATPRPTDSGVTPAAVTPTTPPAAVETPTMAPTDAPNRVVLLALPGSDNGKVIALQEALTELAAADGLEFETRQEPPGLDLSAGTRLVVAVPPDPGMLNLAAANPAIQFLAVGIPGLQAAQNLSVIGSGGDRPDQQGFLAGFLATTITADWRVGVVSAPETPSGKASRNGFSNGVVFFCGLCRPAYPPFVQYPVLADLPAAPSPADIQTAVNTLTGSAVKTVYVSPSVTDPALIEQLAAAGLQIIAAGQPPASAAGAWVASIGVDEIAALRQVWPELLSGGEAVNMDVPLVWTSINPERLSPGRQRVVEKALEDIRSGYIETGVDPQTGEYR